MALTKETKENIFLGWLAFAVGALLVIASWFGMVAYAGYQSALRTSQQQQDPLNLDIMIDETVNIGNYEQTLACIYNRNLKRLSCTDLTTLMIEQLRPQSEKEVEREAPKESDL